MVEQHTKSNRKNSFFRGEIFMPYFAFKEIWTPLKLMKIRFYWEVDEQKYWIKIGSNSRKPLFKD